VNEVRPTSRGRVPWFTLGIGLVALLVLLGLGTWQVERLFWKQNLLAKMHDKVNSPPRSLADLEVFADKTGDADYMPVTLAGRYLHDRESHFLATWKGEAGFFVYTPLQLSDGRYILVNRGFVPYDRKDPTTRAAGQVDGEIGIAGLGRNRLTEKPGALVPDNDPARNIFYWKDLDAMSAHAGLDRAAVLPFFIDANDAPNPGGLPVGGVTMLDLPNNHLQYAITWYGLAAALVAVLGVWTWRRMVSRP
jgi:surfeit locus 1 family protein